MFASVTKIIVAAKNRAGRAGHDGELSLPRAHFLFRFCYRAVARLRSTSTRQLPSCQRQMR